MLRNLWTPTGNFDGISPEAILIVQLERAFLIEHIVPFAAADHAGVLFLKMFPDSKEAKNYGCARTKTTAIVKVMANAINEVVSHLNHAPFSVSTYGCNDASNNAKLYPIVVMFCDRTVCTAFLATTALKGGCTG